MARKISLIVKLVTLVIALAVIPTCVISYIATDHVNDLGDYALESNTALGETAANDSASALNTLGEKVIEQIAMDHAEQVEIYLNYHPNMTVNDIMIDPQLHDISVETVGVTGYTAIVDATNFVILTHKYNTSVGMDLTLLEDRLPSFWAVIEPSAGGNASWGYYDWLEPDNVTVRQKYAYIAPIDATTADGVSGLTLWATTYIHEFSSPADEIKNEINNATLATNDYINSQKSQLTSGLIFVIIVMIIIVIISSIGFARTITKPVYQLKETTNRINKGNLDVAVDVKSHDEIGDLARSFDSMRLSLKSSYENLEQKVRDRTEQIRESERRLADIISFLPDPTFVIDSGGKVIAWNRAIEEMTGIKAENILGKGNHEYALPFYGERRPIVIDLAMVPDDKMELKYKNVQKRGDALIAETFASSLKTEGRYVFAAASALRNSKGQIVGAIEIVRDITDRRRAEEALKESEGRLSRAQEIAHLGGWELDLVANRLNWSDEVYRIFGLQPQEFIATYEAFLDAAHPDDRKAVDNAYSGSLREGRDTYDIEHRIVRRETGEIRWVHEKCEHVRDEAGKIIRSIGMVLDITERKRLELELRETNTLNETLLQTIPFPWDIVGENGEVYHASQSFTDIVGKNPIGNLCWQMYKDDKTQCLNCPLRRGISLGETRSIETHGVLSGRIYLITHTGMIFKDKKAVLEIFQDITERKNLELALLKSKEAAESASETKSEFLANMSHEIRTPMNGITGMIDLTLDSDLTAEQREYLELAKDSARSLLALINDILDFSKIEAKKLDMENVDFDLYEAMDQTMRVLAFDADKKGVELVYEIDAKIDYSLKGDPLRLKQVITNLVKNAIKFTEKGHVFVKASEEDSAEDIKKLHFSVTDTGIGIPKDKLQVIFDKFTQADGSTTRKYGGTGLGLAITKSLVDIMGGSIWVESKEGKGSTFHMLIPFQEGGKIETFPVHPEDLKGLKTLVIDDNPVNRLILRRNLETWGMNVVEATGGQDCIEKIEKTMGTNKEFQILILDCMMPGINGFQVVERLEEKGLTDIIIIMLSSLDQRGNKERSKQIGISEYLIKPVSPSALLNSIMNVLSKKERKTSRITKVKSADYDAEAHIPPETRVLLAEDNIVNRKLAVKLLEKAGLKPVTVENGLEVLKALEKEKFDMILMDVQMPEMDGIDATKKIREIEKEKGGHITIIALTAHAMKGDRERFLEAGMDDYLPKPLNPDEMLRTMEKHVKNESKAKVLDLDDFMKRIGDEEMLADLLEVYLEDAPRIMGEIESAIAKKDAGALRFSAHSLKGMSANLSLMLARETAYELEKMGTSGSLENAENVFRELKEDINKTIDYLIKYLEGKKKGA
jgi:PAS domain S-box-containing protein